MTKAQITQHRDLYKSHGAVRDNCCNNNNESQAGSNGRRKISAVEMV